MKVKVELLASIPETTEAPTQGQIREWIEFQFGYSATLSSTNPLCDHDIHGFIDECRIDEPLAHRLGYTPDQL